MLLTFSINRNLGKFIFSVILSFNILSTSHNIPDLLCAFLSIPLLFPCQFPATDKSWQGNEYVNKSILFGKSLAFISVILTRLLLLLIAHNTLFNTSSLKSCMFFSVAGFLPSKLNVYLLSVCINSCFVIFLYLLRSCFP